MSVPVPYGGLAPFLRLGGVTDVLLGPRRAVLIDRGRGLEPAGAAVGSEEEARALACTLARAAARRLDDASPFVDACLPDGVRLHAIIPPASPDGTVVSLRLPARQPWSLHRLVATGALPPALAEALRALVLGRLSVLVCGPAGAGKTSLLGALLSEVSPGERVVCVEEASELNPAGVDLVRLQARPANVEGAGAVGLVDLVRQALRMRPDRLVVGEVRGAEVVDLFIGLTTGHAGAATIHARGAAEVPGRLRALAVLAGVGGCDIDLIAGTAVDAVVPLERDRSGHRRVAGLAAVGTVGPALTVVDVLDAHGRLVPGVGSGRAAEVLAARGWCWTPQRCPAAALPAPLARLGR